MSNSQTKPVKAGSRGEPEKTKTAILNAALAEFSHEGVAGARTEEIARNAGVNKALLYYYFKSKDDLYAAVLEQALAPFVEQVEAVLDRDDLSAKEKLLRYVETHFDYFGEAPLFPRLVQRELMQTGRNSTTSRVLEHYSRPFFAKLLKLIEQGCRTGEFRGCDAAQTVTSIVGVIAFYFTSIMVPQLSGIEEPFAPAYIAARRAAVLDFISAAVFAK